MALASDYWKHKVLVIFFCIFLFYCPVLFIFYGLVLQPDANEVRFAIRKNEILPSSDSGQDTPALKTILYWNNFFGIENFTFGFGHQPFVDAQCPTHTCTVTNDRMLFNRSDIVIFSAQNMDWSDMPGIRFPHQRFVFYEMESPANTDPQPLLQDRIRFGFFNWTMTYRLDSDIVNRDSYGVIVPRKLTLPSMFPIPHRRDLTAIERKNQYTGSKKKKLVAWFVSNCATASQREVYVKELSRYVPIDIYGKCGNLTCTDRKHCREMLRSDYKFYIGFENSLCTDYVTEKLTTGLLYDTVPIVMGGVDYTQFAPPHSFIDVKDFDSPKQLAKYLLLLNETGSLYERYFDWKTNFDVQLDTKQGWCHLCKLAHDERLPTKTYEDILQWWVNDPESCNLPVGNTPILMPMPNTPISRTH